MNKPATFSAALGAIILVMTGWGVPAEAQQTPPASAPQAPQAGAQPRTDDNGAQSPTVHTGCRNARYGEVLVVKGPVLKLRAVIYNTLSLNDCPQELWGKLDADQIKKQEHSFGVQLNGPRYFMMDTITVDKPGEMKTFGGIPMRVAATVKLSPGTAREQLQAKPYTETKVGWNTQYTFDQGKPMYELITPGGRVYAMESYAPSVDPTLTEDALPTLGGKLKLPTGWQYRVATPDHDVVVGATEKAPHVLQDEMQDTYRRLDAPSGT